MARLARLVFAALAAMAPACASAPASAQAAPRQASPRVMRIGVAPARPTGSAVLGSLAATTQAGPTVALSPWDPALPATPRLSPGRDQACSATLPLTTVGQMTDSWGPRLPFDT